VAGPPPGEPALDDAAFLRALACRLQGTAEPQPLVLAGISNGAGFAEHAARHGLLPLTGLFLAGGTIRESSRQVVPVPRQQAAVTIMAGTGDKMVPYGGGELHAKGAGRVETAAAGGQARREPTSAAARGRHRDRG